MEEEAASISPENPFAGNSSGGWDSWRRGRETFKPGGFAEKFDPSETNQIVKFLFPAPLKVFGQHWIPNPPGDFKRKSYTCLTTVDNRYEGPMCPLCAIGMKASVRCVFNVAVLEDNHWVNKIWETGKQVTQQIEALHEDHLTGPIDKDYFAVNRKKVDKKYIYTFSHTKTRDLLSDREVAPITDEEMSYLKANAYEADALQDDNFELLKQLADLLS